MHIKTASIGIGHPTAIAITAEREDSPCRSLVNYPNDPRVEGTMGVVSIRGNATTLSKH